MRLHHVQLSCPPGGESAATRFWVDGLGLCPVAKPPVLAARGGAWFRGPTCEVHVGVEDGFSPAGKAHPAFVVDDLDAVAARLAALGFPVVRDDDFPGFRRFYTADAHGNRVEMLTSACVPPPVGPPSSPSATHGCRLSGGSGAASTPARTTRSRPG